MNNIRLLPACVLCWLVIGAGWCPAAVTSFFTVTTPGPFSGAPYPTAALQAAVFNNLIPPGPTNAPPGPVNTEDVLLSMQPPRPTVMLSIQASDDGVYTSAPTQPGLHAFFDVSSPSSPFAAATLNFMLQAVPPTPFEPPDPCIVTGQSITKNSFDIFFDTIGPQGTHHYDLDVQANQSLVISTVRVSTGSLDFGFDLSGGSIDTNIPIVTMTLTGTFDPVPEPSTFVIFVGLGGLGLVGYLGPLVA